jgi:hypothetical protein
MSKFILALGAAALAISAPAFAQQGGGQGGGNKGGQQKAERDGNQGRGGGNMRAERGNGGGQVMRHSVGNGRGNEKARGGDRKSEQAHVNGRVEIARGKGRGNDDNVRIVNDDRRDGRDFGRDDSVRVLARNFGGFGGRFDNCPPGLDKKDNGCLPPGQAKKLLGSRLQQNFANSLIPDQYRSWYRDDKDYFYRYGDDNIFRVSRQNNLIDGIIPLFGGGGYYALGDPWPNSYDFYNVPYQYRSYYADGGDYRYRYGDGAIYRVNSGSGVVDGIVALLAGDLGVGSRLPMGYDTYNVPFAYRDRYYDSADNWYRYNDGYIYQVDPKTRLISAVIDAIV